MPIAWWQKDGAFVDNVFVVARKPLTASDRSMVATARLFSLTEERRARKKYLMEASAYVLVGTSLAAWGLSHSWDSIIWLLTTMAGVMLLVVSYTPFCMFRESRQLERDVNAITIKRFSSKDITLFDRRDSYFRSIMDEADDMWPTIAAEMRGGTLIGEQLSAMLAKELGQDAVAFSARKCAAAQSGYITDADFRQLNRERAERFGQDLLTACRLAR